ncbi:programmed cell death 1 ligand 1-like isoform X2 [Pseudochaenichthys georgianus]|uniref:programmed cell death 1 ligand 1-like isoform X2 n=1 Tax=Pseudochaenichthys georgianus TaxID=52239 RepID=UPI00146D11F9|nr:programmed cell death 1 ligand 1-like isoform X2 [Pseudochaenichthys georgianus]
MDWAVIVVLNVMFQPSLSVLFTVEAERTVYESKFGEDVVMGCRFQPKLSNPHDADLKVTWHWFTSTLVRDVYRMDNWKENSAFQDSDYRGRVMLLTDELRDGWSKLKISRLRINDSGTYQCLVQTGEGADYKTTTLSVVAPYKSVTKHIEKAAGGDELLLSCQSEGYPESPVMWQDGHLKTLNPNNTAVTTPQQLVKVTSQIRVGSSAKNNYTCIFTKDGFSATFQIPDEIPVPQKKNDALIVVLSIGVIMVAIIVAMLFYRRQKGCRGHSTRNLLVDGRGLAKNKGNDEEITIFNEGCMEEHLGAFLKDHYSNFPLSTEVRPHCEAFAAEELPHRLQNNEGQPVSLQALLPEAGEVVFLEGPPGSGKTTANILVSSWTEGPTHAVSKLLNLSTVRFLFTVDCSRVKGDLFQEIKMQLSLMQKTGDELRTLLTSEALLVLDGYREGNHFFDESVRNFLMEREGCRVLVTSCPGHCPILNDTVVTGRTLQIQNKVGRS